MIDSFFQHRIKSIVSFPAKHALKLGFTPNIVTTLGLITGLLSAYFVYLNHPYWALAALIVSGILDNLDGAMARTQSGGTPAGAFLDIVFDRLVEVTFLCVIAFKFPHASQSLILLLSSIILSLCVFLTAGALIQQNSYKSFPYIPGLIERTETFILLSVLILLPSYVTEISLVGAGLIFISAIHRFFYTFSFLKNHNNKEEK